MYAYYYDVINSRAGAGEVRAGGTPLAHSKPAIIDRAWTPEREYYSRTRRQDRKTRFASLLSSPMYSNATSDFRRFTNINRYSGGFPAGSPSSAAADLNEFTISRR